MLIAVVVSATVGLGASLLPLGDASAAAQDAAPSAAVPDAGETGGPQDMEGKPEQEPPAPVAAPGVALKKEAELRERVQAWWDAAIKGDFAKAYSLEAPAYRASVPFDEYALGMGRKKVRWKMATLKELRYDRPDAAEAIIALDFSFALPGTDQIAETKADIRDQWTFSDGKWWRKEVERPLRNKDTSGSPSAQ